MIVGYRKPDLGFVVTDRGLFFSARYLKVGSGVGFLQHL